MNADTGVGFEPETLEDDTQSIEHPFDPEKIQTMTLQMPLSLIVTRINHGEIDLNPDFQRRPGLWSKVAQSRLIESLLLKIPLPAFYFDSTSDERWVVVDGLQRLTAIHRFFTGKFRLTGLEFLTDLNNKPYDDLSRPFRRRIDETQLTVSKILPGTPDDVKFNIFKRINTGGLPLSSQEIRRALYRGQASTILEELVASKPFEEATEFTSGGDRRENEELVLRFLAHSHLGLEAYTKSDLDDFLNVAMESLNNASTSVLDLLRTRFTQAMQLAKRIFGVNAFRKPVKKNRTQINKALFETWGCLLGGLSEEQAARIAIDDDLCRKIERGFLELMNDPEYEDSISTGTSSKVKVRLRFNKVSALLEGCL